MTLPTGILQCRQHGNTVARSVAAARRQRGGGGAGRRRGGSRHAVPSRRTSQGFFKIFPFTCDNAYNYSFIA